MDTKYTVSGITCGNCVKHISEELQDVEGVQQVQLDLDGNLVLTSDRAIDFRAVQHAVTEAGDQYAVTPSL